jgi:hypothetical protein
MWPAYTLLRTEAFDLQRSHPELPPLPATAAVPIVAYNELFHWAASALAALPDSVDDEPPIPEDVALVRNLWPDARRVLWELCRNSGLTNKQLQALLDRSKRTVDRRIGELVAKGLLLKEDRRTPTERGRRVAPLCRPGQLDSI